MHLVRLDLPILKYLKIEFENTSPSNVGSPRSGRQSIGS